MRLKNKVALVTGAARGIGQAIALEFAKQGAKVIINYHQSHQKAQNVAEKVKKLGSQSLAVKADISEPNEVSSLVKKSQKTFGRIDILVNNASFYLPLPFEKITKADWIKKLDVNLIGPFLCSQQAAKGMLERKRGNIINVCSVAGLAHSPSLTRIDYSAAKAGLINLTRALAKQLAPHVRVNGIAPGYTQTDFHQNMTKEKRQRVIKNTPLKRMAKPEDIAKAALFLASDDSSYITGEIIVVDGGNSLK